MKNFLYLVGGSTLAQFITIALSPILSRVYSPKDFGLFGFLTSLIYFINSFSLMRLEVELLKGQFSKEEIYQYATTILFIITILLFFLMIIFNISPNYYLLPLLVLVSGYYNLSYYNLLSENNVSRINKNKLILASSIGLSQLLFGIIGVTNMGLIYGHLFGFVFTLLFMSKSFFGFKLNGFIAKFKGNILIDSPGMALNVVSNHGPTLLIFWLLGGVVGGAYYMAFRVLILPVSIISGSLSNYIGSNFLKWGGDTFEQKKILEKIIIYTVPLLFIGYFIIFDIVILLLGDQWFNTALIAKMSIFWLYLRFLFDGYLINLSLYGKYKLNLGFQIFSIVSRSLAILIPFYLGMDFINIIKIFCSFSYFTYLIGLVLIFNSIGFRSKIFNIFIILFTCTYMYLEGVYGF